MPRRHLALSVAGAGALALVALLALGAARRPASGATPPVPEAGQFVLQVLPGPGHEWVVLNSSTGEVQHWVQRDSLYQVTTAITGRKPGYGWRRELIGPAPQ